MKIRSLLAAATLLGVACAPSFGAEPNANPNPNAAASAGRNLFRAQCLLCHSAEAGDNGGAQGPNLAGVLGRKAAATQFGYSAALKSSGLTWDNATLARFLAAPTTVVPGTAMVIPVPQQADRDNLVAYFNAVRSGAPTAQGGAGGPPRGGGGGFAPPPPAPRSQEGADWKKDAPGVVHRVDVAKLPAPGATPSATNFPSVAPKPEGAELKLPKGFKAEVYLTGLTGPRAMFVAPNGDVFLSRRRAVA